jgi:hypothetical protein
MFRALALTAAFLLAACTDATRPPDRPRAAARTASSAASGGAQVFKFRGKVVQAYFDSYDASGCAETSAYVTGNVGPSGKGDSVSVAVSRYDWCTWTFTYAYGSTTQADLQVDKELGAASLTATIPAYEYYSGTTSDLAVNLAWTAIGDATSYSSHSQFRSPEFKVVWNYHGVFRPAEAAGSISDGTTNFAPAETYSAEIDDIKSGYVTISRS